MRAPLLFCSAALSINVQKIFKIVLAKAFDLRCNVQEISEIGHPILEYVCLTCAYALFNPAQKSQQRPANSQSQKTKTSSSSTSSATSSTSS